MTDEQQQKMKQALILEFEISRRAEEKKRVAGEVEKTIQRLRLQRAAILRDLQSGQQSLL